MAKLGPSRLESVPSLCVSNLSLAMESIITTIPKLSIDIVPYNLRPREKKLLEKELFGGLGKLPSIEKVKKLKGRKFDLSKAQLKAITNIVDGRQLSLKGALRVSVSLD